MQLYYSPTSPYVRKVLMVAIEKGLDQEIETVPAPTFTADSPIWQTNPLGKVPALTTREGSVLCNSPLICEYLDSLSENTSLIPRSGETRWRTQNAHALADGIMDASILRTMERRLRPEKLQWSGLHDQQRMKIDKALDFFEQALSSGNFGTSFAMGEIALACALAYLDFRYGDENWRSGHPGLAQWLETVSTRPSFVKTSPPKNL
ncbi:glutathione S-transferase N-terminal domain-containing protein [Kiloniella laminariae]|uniref:Glutathione S-transferase N-terminal domain-containing protein n=1 Tax=Kiloniella laminariae TaxID=454162 RepID=A0ABT4LKJ5_9PROT|nr:glutathione S-transferase N-terminal domain-containing protein [Kiloniella laminariae]MCZ4281629.1 glutathione S-transferase N-terminal domain-containing protein [Kiloniella laminariae]